MRRAVLGTAAMMLFLVGPGRSAEDPRSQVVLRLDCSSRLARQEVTLFANGTIRLRERLPVDATGTSRKEMTLVELGPDELTGYRARLRAENLEEAQRWRYGVEGEWVEQCLLVLQLEEDAEWRFEFGRYDSLDLALSRVVRVAEELVARAEAAKDVPRERLPSDYQVRLGDVLRRLDGLVFEAVAFTSDGTGVELQGLSQPLTVYVLKEDIRSQFPILISRRAKR
jgi:hypothetical protein